MNMKIAFLYEVVKKLIYIIQPTGFKLKRYFNKICRLKKILYGLK